MSNEIPLLRNEKTKSNKSQTATITGFEDVVKNMRQREKLAEQLQTENANDKTNIVTYCKEQQRVFEKQGYVVKSMQVASADGQPAKVTFAERYGKANAVHEDQIRAALGDVAYDAMFETVYEVKLRDQSSYTRLKQLLGDELIKLLEVTPSLKPKPEFMARRAQVRQQLSEQGSQALDSVVDQLQANPSFSLK